MCSTRRIRYAAVVGLAVFLPGARSLRGQESPADVRYPATSDADSLTTALVGPPAPALYIPDRLERLVAQAESMRALTSLIISRRDSVLVERYYRGMRPSQAINVKSVSKTLLSPMVGIALRDGLLTGVDEPLSELLPDYYERLERGGSLDPRKRDIEVWHLLTMRTGIETTSFGNYGSWVASADWAYDQLRRPMICDPGACHEYSTGNTHLLSVILARQSGKSLRRYMLDELFLPLGIPLGEWDRDPQNRYLGGNNISLRPRDMLKFGQLYANGGRYRGEQLVPEEWIEESWRPTGRSPWNGHGYGYLWWMRRWGGERAYFAWGYGGQFIVVVPRLDLVIVTTSSLRDRERGHTRRMWSFFDRYAIPAFQIGWGAEAPDLRAW
ncbi:MAG: serine hydrolase [Candidatus Palauibacterales bacterium]|nr:serine hydrolase [Candidatus Palauibacterales bacterium]